MLLTNEQKREIAQCAHSAWLINAAREGMLESNPTMSATACEAAWRHVEQGKVMGTLRQSLRDATQSDFALLMAHFWTLRAEAHEQRDERSDTIAARAHAARWTARAATDGTRRILFLIRKALAEGGLAEGYAAAICRTQYKCPLLDASEKQLWHLLFTIKNRSKAKG